jgi:hypothetical protein
VNVAPATGASSLHAVHRSHAGNGTTGTPTFAAGPFGSASIPSSQGAGSRSSTFFIPDARTAASRRGSAMGSCAEFWYCQSSSPRTSTEKFGRSTSAPTPPVNIRWLGRTAPTRRTWKPLMTGPSLW